MAGRMWFHGIPLCESFFVYNLMITALVEGERQMRMSAILAASALMGISAGPAIAQDDGGPAGFNYATYYVCDVATQGNMDNVVATNEKPVFDQWVEDGKLIAWGYLSHFTGGRWRRLQYHVSETMDEALANQNAIFQEIYTDNREGGQARAEACEAHDDYIWAIDQGSEPGVDRGDASLSVYFVCSIADQNRADEIFAQTFAPRLNELVEAGDISSWNWQSHVLGGEYRRLQTVTGSDYASVNAARFQTIQHVNQEYPELGREFAQICHTHVDYLWDIVHDAN
jgi:hypothetical protein